MKSSRVDIVVGVRLCSRLLLFMAVSLLSSATAEIVTANGWSRDLEVGAPVDQVRSEPFVLLSVYGDAHSASSDSHVHGHCVFFNFTSARIAIEGTEAPNGDFHPHVVAQVAKNKKAKWKTVGQSSKRGKAATLIVEARGVSKTLMVDMDVFRPMIHTFNYGRLVLKNGNIAVFELRDLLPPKERSK